MKREEFFDFYTELDVADLGDVVEAYADLARDWSLSLSYYIRLPSDDEISKPSLFLGSVQVDMDPYSVRRLTDPELALLCEENLPEIPERTLRAYRLDSELCSVVEWARCHPALCRDAAFRDVVRMADDDLVIGAADDADELERYAAQRGMATLPRTRPQCPHDLAAAATAIARSRATQARDTSLRYAL